MSRASALGVVTWEPESAWGEATATFTKRLSVLEAVDVSGLEHSKTPSGRVQQYLQEGTAHVIGVQGGTVKFKTYLTGHGSSTSGAVTVSDYETYLGYVFGNASASISSGTTFTGGTAAVPTTTVANGFATGSLGRGGAIADAKAGGQWFAVGGHAGNALTLLGALPAAPANGDVCYSAVTIYPWEQTSTATVTSLRFRVQTANQQYELRGCYPRSVTFSGLANGLVPTIEVEFGVSLWAPVSQTFPSAVAQDVSNPAPVAAGSFFMQVAGTTTRATKTILDFTLTVQMGVTPIMAPGGLDQYQVVVGAIRTPMDVRVEIVVAADTATATPTEAAAWLVDTNFYHALYGLSAVNGKSVAFYFPRLVYCDRRPVQYGRDGRNAEKVTLSAIAGSLTSNDLTLSCFRMGFA
jgi:hypothetical protein